MACSAGADRPRRVGARRRQKRPRLHRQLRGCRNTRRGREAQGAERKDSPVAGALASASSPVSVLESRIRGTLLTNSQASDKPAVELVLLAHELLCFSGRADCGDAAEPRVSELPFGILSEPGEN